MIALIPSLTLIVVGSAAATATFQQGRHAQAWAVQVAESTAPGIELTDALQQERRLALLKVVGVVVDPNDVGTARRRVDAAFATETETANTLAALDPVEIGRIAAALMPLAARLPAVRAAIDARTLSADDALAFYSALINGALGSLDVVIHTAPTPATTAAEAVGVGLFQITEAMSRAAALITVAETGGLSPAQLDDFTLAIGYYRTETANLALGGLDDDERDRLRVLESSAAWRRLVADEGAVIRRGTVTDRSVKVDALDWQRDTAEVNTGLIALYREHQQRTLDAAKTNGDRTARRSVWAAVTLTGLGLLVFALSLALAQRLTGRLKRLRRDTLDAAREQLPAALARIRGGETVETAGSISSRSYGRDEIGEVADAFTTAQRLALDAAVHEARIHSGVTAVVSGIAARSQAVIHKQLELLHIAQNNPDTHPEEVEVFFRLDHLATRARRAAENLLILCGQQPGRQWRVPKPLTDIVRSAIQETEEYTRVDWSALPDLSITPGVVADLIHLLAELIDNALSFSPPHTPITVRGHVVGRGIALDVIDWGLGMREENRDEANALLAGAPDFSVITLAEDNRLGHFVVAHLAHRTAATVRLTQSDYGGIHAIVLIPQHHIVDSIDTPTPPPAQTENPYPEPVSGHAVESADRPKHHIQDGPLESVETLPRLPRRTRRIHHSAPILSPPVTDDEPDLDTIRTPEGVRDAYSSLEHGTLAGRLGEHLLDTTDRS